MAASSRVTSKNKPSGESIDLILYRLTIVEQGVSDANKKLDQRDNLKRSDLTEFKEAIFERVAEFRSELQKQVDDKAEKSELDGVKKILYAFGSLFLTVIGGIAIAYFTNSR